MLGKHLCVPLGAVLLLEPGRALDVREEERRRPCRQVRRFWRRKLWRAIRPARGWPARAGAAPRPGSSPSSSSSRRRPPGTRRARLPAARSGTARASAGRAAARAAGARREPLQLGRRAPCDGRARGRRRSAAPAPPAAAPRGGALAARERRVELGEGSSAPERERLAEQLGGLGGGPESGPRHASPRSAEVELARRAPAPGNRAAG